MSASQRTLHQAHRAAALYAAGLGTDRVAHKLHVSKAGARVLLQVAGVTFRPALGRGLCSLMK